jgi:two-component system, chemotaxis family, sensor histidine kinase and response regulator PixL
MNGFEFLEQCRRDPTGQDLPILMLTSRSGEKHQQKARALGATAYLTKPYLEQELLSTLADCLWLVNSVSD